MQENELKNFKSMICQASGEKLANMILHLAVLPFTDDVHSV